MPHITIANVAGCFHASDPSVFRSVRAHFDHRHHRSGIRGMATIFGDAKMTARCLIARLTTATLSKSATTVGDSKTATRIKPSALAPSPLPDHLRQRERYRQSPSLKGGPLLDADMGFQLGSDSNSMKSDCAVRGISDIYVTSWHPCRRPAGRSGSERRPRRGTSDSLHVDRLSRTVAFTVALTHGFEALEDGVAARARPGRVAHRNVCRRNCHTAAAPMAW